MSHGCTALGKFTTSIGCFYLQLASRCSEWNIFFSARLHSFRDYFYFILSLRDTVFLFFCLVSHSLVNESFPVKPMPVARDNNITALCGHGLPLFYLVLLL